MVTPAYATARQGAARRHRWRTRDRKPATPRRCGPGFASYPGGPIDYEVRDLTIVVDGAVAFCHSLNHLAGALWFRSTLGLRNIDGRWRVVHEHNSTPFYMDGSDRGRARPAALMPDQRPPSRGAGRSLTIVAWVRT